ncbi:MAG: M14 family zinc carboxypeptidase [candidate division WOR-3 bacterium]
MLVDVTYSPWNLEKLASEHFDIGYINPRCCIKIIAKNPEELTKLANLGMDYKVEIESLEEYYANRLMPDRPMGGYHRYIDVLNFIDSLRLSNPHIVSEKESIGYTIEGRGIYCVKISDNPELDENEPEVLFNALIHAREPLSMEIILYFMRYLTENYPYDPIVRYIVNERELYFIPILNPDGYVYNEITNPTGGGIWRKNRRINPDGSYGVDLNRNFGFMWGIDNYGSSPNPEDEIYRGEAPFSEPETQSYREFVIRRKFKLIVDNHTFGGMYLYPWGYTSTPTPFSDLYDEYSYILSRFNNYIPIQASDLYPVNGALMDWAFGDTVEKPRIIAFSPELGSPEDGFWPPPERIEQNGEIALKGNLFFSLISGGYIRTKLNLDTLILFTLSPEETKNISFTVKNIGLDTLKNIVIYPRNLDRTIEFESEPHEISVLPPNSSTVYYNTIRCGSFTTPGTRAYFELCTEYSTELTICDTHFIYIGTPTIVYFNNFEGITDQFRAISGPDWERGHPISGPRSAYSGLKCWGTILDGTYSPYSRSVLSSPLLNLSGCTKPMLVFKHWYLTESCEDTIYDGGFVRVRRGGLTETIEPIDHYRGKLYNHNPNGGESAYGGLSDGWETAYFDLSAFAGQTIYVEFVFASDYYIQRPGWYIDDFAIIDFPPTSLEEKANTASSASYLSIFPNPANNGLKIRTDLSHRLKTLYLVDITGKQHKIELKNQPGEINISLERFPSGIYFLVFQSDTISFKEKIIILK